MYYYLSDLANNIFLIIVLQYVTQVPTLLTNYLSALIAHFKYV